MVTKIEKQFFDTFGIEQKEYKECDCDYLNCPNPDRECEECYYYKTYKFGYPAITSRILLELICIISKWGIYLDCIYTIKAKNILNLKQDVIKDYLDSLEECDMDKIALLTENLEWFIKHYIESEEQ